MKIMQYKSRKGDYAIQEWRGRSYNTKVDVEREVMQCRGLIIQK